MIPFELLVEEQSDRNCDNMRRGRVRRRAVSATGNGSGQTADPTWRNQDQGHAI
jgi:hypothetical protein